MNRIVQRALIFVVVTALAALGLFHRQVFGHKTALSEVGTGPARTPSEALARFRAALRDRDYETAGTYCGGDYGETFRRAAPAAHALGSALDDFRRTLDSSGALSDRLRSVLSLLEPFPPDCQAQPARRQGTDRAYAVLLEADGSPLRPDGRVEGWDLDPFLVRSLTRGLSMHVELRAEGPGDDRIWKLHFPTDPTLGANADRLIARAPGCVRALEQTKEAFVAEPPGQADVETRLRKELAAVR
jgi:hypothetical protein